MRISIISAGTKLPDWANEAFTEYNKRLKKNISVTLIEKPLAKRTKNTPQEAVLATERDALLSAAGGTDTLIALDERGQSLTTRGLSEKLEHWQLEGVHAGLLIGGPDGLHADCLSASREHWALSGLTLAHPMVRVLLAEQLYRAWSLLNGHPYHRG